MPKTTQMNIRVSNSLLADIDFVTRVLGVNRSEWIKVKFAELIVEEKDRMMRKIDERFIMDKITDKDYEKIVGSAPSDQLVYKKMSAKDGTRNYIKSVLKGEHK